MLAYSVNKKTKAIAGGPALCLPGLRKCGLQFTFFLDYFSIVSPIKIAITPKRLRVPWAKKKTSLSSAATVLCNLVVILK